MPKYFVPKKEKENKTGLHFTSPTYEANSKKTYAVTLPKIETPKQVTPLPILPPSQRQGKPLAMPEDAILNLPPMPVVNKPVENNIPVVSAISPNMTALPADWLKGIKQAANVGAVKAGIIPKDNAKSLEEQGMDEERIANMSGFEKFMTRASKAMGNAMFGTQDEVVDIGSGVANVAADFVGNAGGFVGANPLLGNQSWSQGLSPLTTGVEQATLKGLQNTAMKELPKRLIATAMREGTENVLQDLITNTPNGVSIDQTLANAPLSFGIGAAAGSLLELPGLNKSIKAEAKANALEAPSLMKNAQDSLFKYGENADVLKKLEDTRIANETKLAQDVEDYLNNLEGFDYINSIDSKYVRAENNFRAKHGLPPLAEVKTVETQLPSKVVELPKVTIKKERVVTQPDIYYHGTNEVFNEFDPNKLGLSTGNEGLYGNGIYFTNSPSYAKFYGDNIKKATLDIKNPFIVDYKVNLDELAKLTGSNLKPEDKRYNILNLIEDNPKTFTDNLKKLGYDGVIAKDGLETVVFDPKQIKALNSEFKMSEVQEKAFDGFKERTASRNGTLKEIRVDDEGTLTRKGTLYVLYDIFGREKAAIIGPDGRTISFNPGDKSKFKLITDNPLGTSNPTWNKTVTKTIGKIEVPQTKTVEYVEYPQKLTQVQPASIKGLPQIGKNAQTTNIMDLPTVKPMDEAAATVSNPNFIDLPSVKPLKQSATIPDIKADKPIIDLPTVKAPEVESPKSTANKSGDAISLLEGSDSWKDKPKLLYRLNNMRRNFYDIIPDKQEADRVISQLIDPIGKNEADNVRMMNKVRDEVKQFNIKSGSKESELAQKLLEKKISLDEVKKQTPKWENVKGLADYLSKQYDDLIDKANTVLGKHGYDKINKRSNYAPHFGDENEILKSLGLDSQKLPTDINGLTGLFRPGKPWFRNFLKRTGDETVYDAVKGFDRYVEGIGRVIYHTSDIKAMRDFEDTLRLKYKGGDTHLSNLVTEIRDFGNILANKKSMLDRGTESEAGRGIYNVMDGIRRKVSANMVGGNVSSALTNFIPLTQALAETDKSSFFKGMVDTVKSMFKDDGFIDQSDFLTRRMGSERIATNAWQKISNGANWLFKVIDDFTSNVIVRGKYAEGIKNGMDPESALKQADEFAASVMADRTLGQSPLIFYSKSPLISPFTMFQQEVLNQVQHLYKDIPREAFKNGVNSKSIATITAIIAQTLVYNYGFNTLYEMLTGRRPAFDIIGVVQKTIEDYNNPELNDAEATSNLIDNITDQIPFASTISGGGRIPINSAIPDINVIKNSIANQDSSWQGEAVKPFTYLLPPTGGGQLKKTIEGLGIIKNQGAYNDDKTKLKYPVEITPGKAVQSVILGPSALPETRAYYDNNRDPLSKDQMELYRKELSEYKGNKDAQEIYQGIINARTINSLMDKINSVADNMPAKTQNDVKSMANFIKYNSINDEQIIQKLTELLQQYTK